MLYALSENVEGISEKVNMFILLAPIAKVGTEDDTCENSVYHKLWRNSPFILNLLGKFNLWEYFGES